MSGYIVYYIIFCYAFCLGCILSDGGSREQLILLAFAPLSLPIVAVINFFYALKGVNK